MACGRQAASHVETTVDWANVDSDRGRHMASLGRQIYEYVISSRGLFKLTDETRYFKS